MISQNETRRAVLNPMRSGLCPIELFSLIHVDGKSPFRWKTSASSCYSRKFIVFIKIFNFLRKFWYYGIVIYKACARQRALSKKLCYQPVLDYTSEYNGISGELLYQSLFNPWMNGRNMISAFFGLHDNGGWCFILAYAARLRENSVALSPQANHTDWATATCRRNILQAFSDRGVSRGKRGGSPTAVNLSFLDRRRGCDWKGILNRIFLNLWRDCLLQWHRENASEVCLQKLVAVWELVGDFSSSDKGTVCDHTGKATCAVGSRYQKTGEDIVDSEYWVHALANGGNRLQIEITGVNQGLNPNACCSHTLERRMPPSWMLRCVALVRTGVSEELSVVKTPNLTNMTVQLVKLCSLFTNILRKEHFMFRDVRTCR
jgi:hypothetical protein